LKDLVCKSWTCILRRGFREGYFNLWGYERKTPPGPYCRKRRRIYS